MIIRFLNSIYTELYPMSFNFRSKFTIFLTNRTFAHVHPAKLRFHLNPHFHYSSGWILRIYTNYAPENPKQREWMCWMQCNYTNVDICLVDRLPGLGNISRLQDQGRTWRFLPGMDPLVDIFISRYE